MERRAPSTQHHGPGNQQPIPRLNAIIDVDHIARCGWTPIAVARAFLAGGATFLQLRAKSASGREFFRLAADITRLARAAGATLIVNDRADIARLAAADGVHVGQDDLPPSLVRRIVGSDAKVGLSTHTVEQLGAAVAEPVSYVAVGPVFGSATKITGYDAIGLDLVRAAAARAAAAGLPLVAIGGITLETAPMVLAAGASSVAVISDLLSTSDPEGRTRAYVERLRV